MEIASWKVFLASLDECLGTVKVSTQGEFRDWEMRQERKSPNYTTCWDQVPVV